MAKKKTTKKTTKPKGPPAPPQTFKDVRTEGTATKGTKIGNAREIYAAQIAPAAGVGVQDLAPTATYEGAQVAPAQQFEAATIDPVQQAQFREKQMQLANALQLQANGQGPSLAALQLKDAMNRNIAGLRGSLAGTGTPRALAARILAQQYGQASQQTAMQAAQARILEQQNAQQQLAALAASGREADIGLATNQAGLTQQAAAANAAAVNAVGTQQANLTQQAGLANQAATNQMSQFANDQALRAALANQVAANTRAQNQAQLEQQATLANQQAVNQLKGTQGQISAGIKGAEIGANAAVDVANINQETQLVSNAQDNANAAGTTTASDIRLKKDVMPADDQIQEFLDKIKAIQFEYKNKSVDGAGERTGVAAQDLEKSQAGRQVVEDTPRGKMIDLKKLLPMLLAAQSNLNKRMSAMEKG